MKDKELIWKRPNKGQSTGIVQGLERFVGLLDGFVKIKEAEIVALKGDRDARPRS